MTAVAMKATSEHDARARATDPARLARLSLALVSFFFALGVTVAFVLRAETITAGVRVLDEGLWLRLANAHALVMTFFCAIPALSAVFGHLLLPLAVGRRTHAFGILGQWGVRLHLIAGVVLVASIASGAVAARWDLVSALQGADAVPAILLGTALHLMALSVIATAMSQLATLVVARRDDGAPMGPFAVTIAVQALVAIASAPVLAGWAALFVAESTGGAAVFGAGGTHALSTFARLFAFAVQGGALMITIAGAGIVLEVFAESAGREGRAMASVAVAAVLLAVFGAFGHGVALVGASGTVAGDAVASGLALLMAIPAALWFEAMWRTVRRGFGEVDAALLHGGAFVVHAAVIGATGLALASLATGPFLRDSAFATAHLHLVFVGLGGSAFFAALHRWGATLLGAPLGERDGRVGAALVFAGTQLAFLPRLVLGAQGLPSLTTSVLPAQQALVGLSSLGMVVLVIGVLVEGKAILGALLARGEEKGAA